MEHALTPVAILPAVVEVATPSKIEEKRLTTHVGSYSVELDAVRAVTTPAANDTFFPIDHGRFYDRIRAELGLANIGITEELHALYGHGARYIGLAVTDLKSPGGDAEIVVGWFNAHDRSAAATLLLGERVMVCFNLSLHAEVKVTRRHTKHIGRDLPGLVAGAVGSFAGRIDAHARRMDRYRTTPLAERDAGHLLIQLVEHQGLTPGVLPGVLREWREPSHAEFADGWTVNRLYQAITAHPAPLNAMARRHRALHHVFDGWCDRFDQGPEPLRRLGRLLAEVSGPRR